MKRKFITFGVSLLLSANLMAQSAQDFKQTYADLSVFEDAFALKLKKGVKKKQVEQIGDTTLRRVALSMLNGKYSKDYRYATYSALLNPSTLGHQLSIGDGYSKYENMTGVYLPKGQHIVIVDGIANGKEVNLVVPNWLRKAPDPTKPTEDPKGWGLEKQEFRLHNGVNIIQL
ncbi:MAG: M60 family peptidase N-terminal accessory domain-containing protein, partial [Sphingobacterium sp.]